MTSTFGAAWAFFKANPDLALSARGGFQLPPGCPQAFPTQVERNNPPRFVLGLSPVVLLVRLSQKAFQKSQPGIRTQCTCPPINFCLFSFKTNKCFFYLRNLKLPSWGKNICSVYFPSPYNCSQFKGALFSSDFTPAVHSSSNLFIHLFEASLNSLWPPRPFIQPSLPRRSQSHPSVAGQRQSLHGWGGGGAHFTME